MKSNSSSEPIASSPKPETIKFWLLALSYLLLAISLAGCIRLSGTAGYSKIKNDEVVTKATGFDVDTARLIDQRGVS